jgi:fluoroacetyl-CoA thioesterase
MKRSFKKGLSCVRKFTVDANRTIDFMGEDCRVYGTPEMIRDIEWTCRDLMFEHADAGEDSVGVGVSVVHSAPTPFGMDVDITVTVAEIDRSRVVFDVTATDPVDSICSGQHERFFVDLDKTKKRLQAKIAQAAEAV